MTDVQVTGAGTELAVLPSPEVQAVGAGVELAVRLPADVYVVGAGVELAVPTLYPEHVQSHHLED